MPFWISLHGIPQADLVLRPPRHRVCLARRPRRFEKDGGRQKFYDAHYGSCTKLIAEHLARKVGLTDTPTLTELVRWADIIDAARFPSAEMAVMRADPRCGS